jgi:hypothetical protein
VASRQLSNEARKLVRRRRVDLPKTCDHTPVRGFPGMRATATSAHGAVGHPLGAGYSSSVWASGFDMSRCFLRLFFLIAVALLTACDRGRERANVLTGRGEPEVMLMDFSAPFPLDPLPPGWYHRTFWTRAPMQMAFVVKEGVPSLRFETRSTASMLFRHIDLVLADYPFLIWRWYIEQPIESPLDERTHEGDCLLIADSIKKLHHVWPRIGDAASMEMRVAIFEWARKGLRVQHGLSSLTTASAFAAVFWPQTQLRPGPFNRTPRKNLDTVRSTNPLC